MTLDNGAHSYTEHFHIDPPSLSVGFPLPAESGSEKSGDPLPPGEYTRQIVATSADGDQVELTTMNTFLPTVTVARP